MDIHRGSYFKKFPGELILLVCDSCEILPGKVGTLCTPDTDKLEI
jgi:hypothetical protein